MKNANQKIVIELDIEKVVGETVARTLEETLPDILRKATRQKWLKTDDVMEILRCSRRHVQHLRDSGRLPFRQHGRTIRYDIDEIENYLNQGKVNNNGDEKA